MSDHPQFAAERGRVEPAPRRVRGLVGDTVVFDTVAATYVWEAPYYPQYYVPLADVAPGLLVDPGPPHRGRLGTARSHALAVGDERREDAARVFDDEGAEGAEGAEGVSGRVRFRWDALDAWFEEDEEVFVHPRSPYTRVDALRSHRHVVVELDGVVLADTTTPVLVFETGLPTRYYVDRTDVRFEHLVPTGTVTQCPYKGTTSQYWSVRTPSGLHEDLAWSYRFTTDAVRAVAGLVAFYNEKVDLTVDGVALPRPATKFS